jgi:protein-S-isoprenylcysteine O-methyltransferase Ste14
MVLTAAGEALRLWAVHHIGVISRTRSGRLGPLIDSGPFAVVRNPLYIGNILLWVGFTLTARLVWLAPFVALLLALEYHAIVRWEEQLLESRYGSEYRKYAARVPRWLPRLHEAHEAGDRHKPDGAPTFSLAETLFSERGTLLAIAGGYVLLWLKAQI